MPTQIRATVTFAIVPEWLLDADVSDRAVRVYALLARYANQTTGTAFPTRKTLARRARCSLDTLDRALKELVTAGAVSIEAVYHADGDRAANTYTLNVAAPVVSGSRTDAATSPHESDDPVAATTRPRRRDNAADNESHLTRVSDNESQPVLRDADAPHDAPPRMSNPAWDALVAALGYDPVGKAERMKVGKALKIIKEAGFGADDIPRLAEVYRRTYPRMAVTALALANNAESLLRGRAETLDGYSQDFIDIWRDDLET